MSFEKIPMKTPLVEMDGDEMTRVKIGRASVGKEC